LGARQMVDDFHELLEAVAAAPDRKLSEFSISKDARLARRQEVTPVADLSALPPVAASAAERSASPDRGPASNTADADEVYELPASVTQERFWLLTKIAPDGSAFNMPAVVRISGPLSVEVLERSFQYVIDRHELLRTTFHEDRGKLLQRIAGKTP